MSSKVRIKSSLIQRESTSVKGKRGSILAEFPGLLLIQENENGCLIWGFFICYGK